MSKNNWLLLILTVLVGAAAVMAFQNKRKHHLAGGAGDLSEIEASDRWAFQESDSFEPVQKPRPGDWMATYKEPGQNFAEYLDSNPNIPDDKRRVIYIYPIGEFPDSAPRLKLIEEYTALYFHPLEVKTLPITVMPPKETRMRARDGVTQWCSDDLIENLKAEVPQDAYAMIAVMMVDLYPNERWNFVFGQASLKDRVGVFSLARYKAKKESLQLLRACKVLTHEFGHMFGIHHCTAYECNMNGANNIREVDDSPIHVCTVCLRKLHHALGFDPKERYEAMSKFYKRNGLDDELAWITERLKEVK